jgi:penicillin-binding protein 1A
VSAPRERRRRHRRATRTPIKALSVLRLLLLLTVWGASLGAAVVALAVRTLNEELPADLTTLLDYSPSRKSLVISADGEEIGAFSIENRKQVPLDRMPPHVPAAFVSAEDRRFWQHPGFDVVGIARAAWTNMASDRIKQGGSTLTQQIIKQIILADVERFDSTGMSPEEIKAEGRRLKYRRKAMELILSIRLERELSKVEIITIYLNHVYLGHGAYGVGAAAETYFGKDVENLTIAEAGMLAGLVKSPSTVAPHLDIDAARERQIYVLQRMREDGFISDSEYGTAVAEPIALVESGDLNHLAAPYFVEHVRRTATQQYGNSELFRGGLRFYATLDTRMQAAAEAALRRGLETLDRRLGFRGPIGKVDKAERAGFADGPPRPYRAGEGVAVAIGDALLPDTTYAAMVVELPKKGRGGSDDVVVDLGPVKVPLTAGDSKDVAAWKGKSGETIAVGDLLPVRLAPGGEHAVVTQTPALQGALVAMDLQGRVKAMVGGYDWGASQYNRAAQAHRQIGSAIKPFIYAAAVANGSTEVDRMYDGPIFVPTATGVWSPSNYDGKYTGAVSLRTALAKSLNTISVQLLVNVGLDRVIDVMRGFGIASPIPRHVSISLGTPDLTLLEVAAGYAGIASGGRRVDARMFDLVTDPAGAIVEDLRVRPPGPAVIAPDVAYVVVDMMKGVVTRGTARRAAEWGRPSAGKTGTSANYRDVWFIGFTTDLLCGVWIGRDDSTPIGDEITGGGAAVPIWLEFMKAAHPPTPPRDFAVPAGVTFARSDDWSGGPAYPSSESVWVPFARGTMPSRFAARTPATFFDRVPAPNVP